MSSRWIVSAQMGDHCRSRNGFLLHRSCSDGWRQRLPRVCCTQNVVNPLQFYCLCHDAMLDPWPVHSRLAPDCLYTCLCVFALHRRNEPRLKEVRMRCLQLPGESVLKTTGCGCQLGSDKSRLTREQVGSPPTVQIRVP